MSYYLVFIAGMATAWLVLGLLSASRCGDCARKRVEGQSQPEPDVCGFCGKPGADKVYRPSQWPGENYPGTEFVHAECEDREAQRAMTACRAMMGDEAFNHMRF